MIFNDHKGKDNKEKFKGFIYESHLKYIKQREEYLQKVGQKTLMFTGGAILGWVI
jgi:hypothetical protein